MVLKKGRRSLPEAEEDEQIVQPIPIEDCWWEFFTQEIFHRLPANQLQTIKGVCRNWFRAISSPNFVGLHLKIYNESRIRVVVYDKSRVIEYKFNINSEETMPIHSTLAIRSSIGSSLLGSCDGLLCFQFEGSRRSIAVYNPSTGNYFWPISSLKHVCCSWFGHHPSSGEYVLVLGYFDREIGVYKFNHRSNFELIHSTSSSVDPQFYFYFYERIGTLLHGAIHWPVQRNLHRGDSLHRHVIYAYHLDDNKYLEISPPVQPLHLFKLGVAQGCLFAILRPTNAQAVSEFEMWIMKEYGVEESWIKYANIRGLNSFRDLNCRSDVVPLGFFPNGDLVLDVDRYILIKYNFNDNKAELLTHRKYGKTIMCADSLVSPRIVGT